MPLLNYTTSVAAHRTVGQIQDILAEHGARALLMEYGNAGEVTSLSFKMETPQGLLAFRLPVDAKAIQTVLERQRVQPRYFTQEHAMRVAWRILKDWVEAQMALLETEMVRMEEIFLPYLITPGGQTLFQSLANTGFQLTEGKQEGG